MQDRTLTLFAEDGSEIVCDILFTYHYEKTDKDYVVFQVRQTQEVSAAIYQPTENGEGRLEAVQTEEEWKMLEDLLNDYASRMDEEGCSGSCSTCGGCGGNCDCDGDCDCGGDCE